MVFVFIIQFLGSFIKKERNGWRQSGKLPWQFRPSFIFEGKQVSSCEFPRAFLQVGDAPPTTLPKPRPPILYNLALNSPQPTTRAGKGGLSVLPGANTGEPLFPGAQLPWLSLS